jgi:2-polyprenyl-6-methoxyphenol hydroxylase-like FAD-dependent oxidoreductase
VRSRLRGRFFGMKRHVRLAESTAGTTGTVGLHLVPGGYVGTCRIEPPWTNVCGLLPEALLRRHRGQLDRLAQEHFACNPALAHVCNTAVGTGDWKTVAGVRVEVSVPVLPGIFYAGDCQGTIDPLGGQGMTMALLGSEVLAPYVESALVRGCAEPSLQRASAAEWRERFDRRIALCRAFHHVLVNPAVVDALARFTSLAPRLLAACYRQTRDAQRLSVS